MKERTFETPCAATGKIPSSKGCGSHKPDAFALVRDGDGGKLNTLRNIADAIHGMSSMDLQVLAGLLLREKITRKSGFSFLQKVYVRVQGNGNESYLNDFVVGYVLDANKETVRVIGETGVTSISAMNDPESLTLYSAERFASLRAEMVRKKRISNPRTATVKTPNPFADGIMPLDSVDPELLYKKKSITKSQRDDLTKLVSRLGRGVIRTKKSSAAHIDDGEISISHE